jgi:hypothetical protein
LGSSFLLRRGSRHPTDQARTATNRNLGQTWREGNVKSACATQLHFGILPVAGLTRSIWQPLSDNEPFVQAIAPIRIQLGSCAIKCVPKIRDWQARCHAAGRLRNKTGTPQCEVPAPTYPPILPYDVASQRWPRRVRQPLKLSQP